MSFFLHFAIAVPTTEKLKKIAKNGYKPPSKAGGKLRALTDAAYYFPLFPVVLLLLSFSLFYFWQSEMFLTSFNFVEENMSKEKDQEVKKKS